MARWVAFSGRERDNFTLYSLCHYPFWISLDEALAIFQLGSLLFTHYCLWCQLLSMVPITIYVCCISFMKNKLQILKTNLLRVSSDKQREHIHYADLHLYKGKFHRCEIAMIHSLLLAANSQIPKTTTSLVGVPHRAFRKPNRGKDVEKYQQLLKFC